MLEAVPFSVTLPLALAAERWPGGVIHDLWIVRTQHFEERWRRLMAAKVTGAHADSNLSHNDPFFFRLGTPVTTDTDHIRPSSLRPCGICWG